MPHLIARMRPRFTRLLYRWKLRRQRARRRAQDRATLDAVSLDLLTPRRNRAIAWFWIGTLGISAACLPVLPWVTTLGYFVAVVLSLVTWLKSSKAPLPLRYRGWYRAALGSLCLVGAAGVVSAASMVAINRETGDEKPVLFCLASTFALIAILSWRALVRPTPRRAAGVALLALAGVMFALIIDVLIDTSYDRGYHDVDAEWSRVLLGVGLIGSFLAGPLVSLASVTAFARSVDEAQLPEARQLPPA